MSAPQAPAPTLPADADDRRPSALCFLTVLGAFALPFGVVTGQTGSLPVGRTVMTATQLTLPVSVLLWL